MRRYFILILLLIIPLSIIESTYAITTNNSIVVTTVTKPIKKLIIRKTIKKIPQISTESVSTEIIQKPAEVVYGLNKPFILGDIEYTILSSQTFDKIGVQNSAQDFHISKN